MSENSRNRLKRFLNFIWTFSFKGWISSWHCLTLLQLPFIACCLANMLRLSHQKYCLGWWKKCYTDRNLWNNENHPFI